MRPPVHTTPPARKGLLSLAGPGDARAARRRRLDPPPGVGLESGAGPRLVPEVQVAQAAHRLQRGEQRTHALAQTVVAQIQRRHPRQAREGGEKARRARGAEVIVAQSQRGEVGQRLQRRIQRDCPARLELVEAEVKERQQAEAAQHSRQRPGPALSHGVVAQVQRCHGADVGRQHGRHQGGTHVVPVGAQRALRRELRAASLHHPGVLGPAVDLAEAWHGGHGRGERGPARGADAVSTHVERGKLRERPQDLAQGKGAFIAERVVAGELNSSVARSVRD
mmetsp:Transcript_11676/g.32521  ORF Transcript_11676/g.32521 Transcript_11676/m.32521 type:complete len:280 (+) Transcript_11676:348-1187(+)